MAKKKLSYAEERYPKGSKVWYEGHKATVLTYSASNPYIVGIGWIDSNGEPYTITVMCGSSLIPYPTEEQAKEFYRDLCGTVNGNADKQGQGILSLDGIADAMEMDFTERAEAFMMACAEYGITEKQGGLWVV